MTSTEPSAPRFADRAVLIEFLERFETPAAAALSLRSVDDLPCLIVLLLETVAGFGKVEDHCDEDAKDLEVVEHFEKSPMPEPKGDPFAAPFNGPEGHSPDVLDMLSPDRPGFGSLALNLYFHRSNLPPGVLAGNETGRDHSQCHPAPKPCGNGCRVAAARRAGGDGAAQRLPFEQGAQELGFWTVKRFAEHRVSRSAHKDAVWTVVQVDVDFLDRRLA